jgi:NAD(P)-dependent dehydrogenase (short-subunit alcohol dehydrogenase family)
MRIEGSGALISGGASGLGAATSRRLHAAGARVVIADLNAEKGEQLATPRPQSCGSGRGREDRWPS